MTFGAAQIEKDESLGAAKAEKWGAGGGGGGRFARHIPVLSLYGSTPAPTSGYVYMSTYFTFYTHVDLFTYTYYSCYSSRLKSSRELLLYCYATLLCFALIPFPLFSFPFLFPLHSTPTPTPTFTSSSLHLVGQGPAVLAAGAGSEGWLYFVSHLSCLPFTREK